MQGYEPSEVAALKKADKEHFFHPTSSITKLQAKGPKIMASGKGCMVYDIDNKAYIDGTAGLWLNSVGHGRSEIAEVAKSQMETLEYYQTFNEFSNIPAIKLATKLAETVPLDNAKVFFTSGGSESNDTAFKIARFYFYSKGQEEKNNIISRNRAYHGVSYGSVTATMLPNFHEGFKPLVPGFSYIDPPYCYVCPFKKKYPGCNLECAAVLEEKITELGEEKVAAFVAEPISGTGGVIVPPPGYYEKIREICDRYDILFISDEVICGFGRTGTRFGIEHWNVKPDIISLAKGMTSGYMQLGAVVLPDKIFQVLKSQDMFYHGYTYSGHPVACAVGLKNIEIIERENLMENAVHMGNRLVSGLKSLNLEAIGEVRGKGLMVGVDLVKTRANREKFDAKAGFAVRVAEIAYENGLICRGLSGDIIQLSPPLIISEHESYDYTATYSHWGEYYFLLSAQSRLSGRFGPWLGNAALPKPRSWLDRCPGATGPVPGPGGALSGPHPLPV